MIQQGYGPQNNTDSVFFTTAGEAVIFVNYAFLSKGKRNMTFY